jgi:hypothetical protein
MVGDFPEKDWKVFRSLHPIACERYCNQAISELEEILSKTSEPSGHRFWDALKAADRHAEEIRTVFDDFRRSTALIQLMRMRVLGLIHDNEMSRFSEETQKIVKLQLGR